MMTYQVSAFALAIVFFANISYIVNADQAFYYNVAVQTSGSTKFSAHEGKLKLSVVRIGEETTEDFILTPRAVNLTMNSRYTGEIKSSIWFPNIKSVYLSWTLATPNSPDFATAKPSIYFDEIVLEYWYTTSEPVIYGYPERINRHRLQKFCPPTQPIGIAHADGASFHACGPMVIEQTY
ncbi:uncharacterized protein LOC107363953 [Tetranychus urticae]|uniref:Uncharacterized protein n=1 Tax=Tetranychus urticae TaxID=32264 RepID=T1KHV3_TETUR|nr:uncharacterized protein LOC107363953 [Tetranychus urticae]